MVIGVICTCLTRTGNAFLTGSIRNLFKSVVSVLTLSLLTVSVFCADADKPDNNRIEQIKPGTLFITMLLQRKAKICFFNKK